MRSIRSSDRYFSERQMPLITQHPEEDIHEDYDVPGEERRILLTAERYEKWYDLYLIMPNNTVHQLSEFRQTVAEAQSRVLYTIIDHTYAPAYVIELCRRFNARMELSVYDAICRRFLQDGIGVDGAVFTRESTENLNADAEGGTPVDPDYFPSTDDLIEVLVDGDFRLIV